MNCSRVKYVQHKYQLAFAYKFSKDVNFSDDQNLGFSWFYFRGSFVFSLCAQLKCIVIVLKVSFLYIDDKLPAKSAKITPLENLHVYSRFNIGKRVRQLYIYIYIKTHGSESRGQGGSTLRRPRRTHVSILQEQTLLK